MIELKGGIPAQTINRVACRERYDKESKMCFLIDSSVDEGCRKINLTWRLPPPEFLLNIVQYPPLQSRESLAQQPQSSHRQHQVSRAPVGPVENYYSPKTYPQQS